MTALAPAFDEGIKQHENGNIADARRGRRLRDHRHVAFLNLQVAGWVFILTGVAGAIISRNSWLRRTLIVKGATGAAAAGGTGQRPPPSRRPMPGSHPAAVPYAMPAERETIEEHAGA